MIQKPKSNLDNKKINCELNENIICDLQSAISLINDEVILHVNFDNGIWKSHI